MNICMFTNTYLPHVGGVARSVHSFAMDLRQMGHRVLIMAPEYKKESEFAPEQDTVRLAALQHFNGSEFSLRIPLPFVVEREIESFAPDIIHSHHPYILGDTALRVAHKNRLPLVFTHHTLYEKYVHYLPLESDRLESFVISLATLYANHCDQVIAPSPSIAGLIRSRGVTSPVSEIGTGVDVRFFADGRRHHFRNAYCIPRDALVLGHLSRLAAEKNLDYLARAVSLFMSDHPQACFLVVGAGPCSEEIQAVFAQAGMADRLIMPGELTGRSIADAYHAMDLFVFASLSETQGMVLAEAMAAGLPVVALDASGVRDIVEDQGNGRLLTAGSTPSDFAAAIHDSFADPERLSQWRIQALQTAQNNSRQVSARKLAVLYGQVLERRGGERQVTPEFNPLDNLLARLKLEWSLLSGKIKSVIDAEPTSAAE
jgi:1,2-diacylglycerol 3-alpha-glucosyltransferase